MEEILNNRNYFYVLRSQNKSKPRNNMSQYKQIIFATHNNYHEEVFLSDTSLTVLEHQNFKYGKPWAPCVEISAHV